VGFGVIEQDPHQHYHALDWGIIRTSQKDSEASRLAQLQEAMQELIRQTKPDMASIEKLFFFRNAKTLMPVSQARGVILVTFYQAGLSYVEYTPMQVKLNMTGYGRSSKTDIQQMVQQLLNMEEPVKSDDAADALAIALSCAFEQQSTSLLAARF